MKTNQIPTPPVTPEPAKGSGGESGPLSCSLISQIDPYEFQKMTQEAKRRSYRGTHYNERYEYKLAELVLEWAEKKIRENAGLSGGGYDKVNSQS